MTSGLNTCDTFLKPPIENHARMWFVFSVLFLWSAVGMYRGVTVVQESSLTMMMLNLSYFTLFPTLWFWIDSWVAKRKGDVVSGGEINHLIFSQTVAIVSLVLAVIFAIETELARKAVDFSAMNLNQTYAKYSTLGLVLAMFWMPFVGAKRSVFAEIQRSRKSKGDRHG